MDIQKFQSFSAVSVFKRPQRIFIAKKRQEMLVRHVHPWSVLKVAFVIHAVFSVVTLSALVAFYRASDSFGWVSQMEETVQGFGREDFLINGEFVFTIAATGITMVALLSTLFAFLAAVVYNHAGDIVGGIYVTVDHHEVVRREVDEYLKKKFEDNPEELKTRGLSVSSEVLSN